MTDSIPDTAAHLPDPMKPEKRPRGGWPMERRARETVAPCPKWENLGHNWLVIKGWLPWRRYRVCTGCHHEERIK